MSNKRNDVKMKKKREYINKTLGYQKMRKVIQSLMKRKDIQNTTREKNKRGVGIACGE